MRNILSIISPNDYAEYLGAPVLHPQVCVIHYDELEVRSSLNNYAVYGLFIQRTFPNDLSYGTKKISVEEGSIIAVAPGQLGGREDNGDNFSLSGWALLWSPEILHGTDLEAKMKEYRYFSYFCSDPLKMTPEELGRLSSLVQMLRQELLDASADPSSIQGVILGYLRLIMEYCNKIYLRQQNQSVSKDKDVLKRFNALLEDYYQRDLQLEKGIPSVAYFANELAYSPRYFGDVIHKTTGSTAIQHIHNYVVNQGKSLLMKGYSVSEAAYRLGFEYPHHFSRVFKKVMGISPRDFVRK